MKSYRKELHYNIKTRRAYVNITPQVEAALAESGIRECLCLINAMDGFTSRIEKELLRLGADIVGFGDIIELPD